MRKLRVCLTSDLYCHYDDGDNLVVVIDILRATSVISTAFHYGIKEVIVVSSLQEASKYLGMKGYIVGAERNAMPLENFDYGNSPFQYMNKAIKGQKLVLTTTNGTKAINLAKKHQVITASYLNIDAVHQFICSVQKDVVLVCSGWKGLVNMEDSIFAGELSCKLLESNLFEFSCDSVIASTNLYHAAGEDLFNFLENSSHRKRLQHLDAMEHDTRFCLSPTFRSEIIPMLKDGRLIDVIS